MAVKKEPRTRAVLTGYALVAGGWLLGWLIWDQVEGVTVDKIEGLTLFAGFFVLAQAVERLIEPFVAAPADADTANGKVGLLGQGLIESDIADADQRKADRRAWIWGLATAVALVLVGWTHLDFLAMVGVRNVPREAALLVTGLVVGSGTKPLHDLVKRLETKPPTPPAAPGATPPAQPV